MTGADFPAQLQHVSSDSVPSRLALSFAHVVIFRRKLRDPAWHEALLIFKSP